MYESPNIADLIKFRAKEQGIPLKTMLSDLSLGSNTISNMRHNRMIAADSLARIADYLNCSVDYLLGRQTTSEIENNSNTELPFSENKTAFLKELYEIASKLPDEQICDILEYAQFKKGQQKGEG